MACRRRDGTGFAGVTIFEEVSSNRVNISHFVPLTGVAVQFSVVIISSAASIMHRAPADD